MIFGKMEQDRKVEQQHEALSLALGEKSFAILCKLEDGRWAFFQDVWTYRDSILTGEPETGEIEAISGGGWGDFVPIDRCYAQPAWNYIRIFRSEYVTGKGTEHTPITDDEVTRLIVRHARKAFYAQKL